MIPRWKLQLVLESVDLEFEEEHIADLLDAIYSAVEDHERVTAERISDNRMRKLGQLLAQAAVSPKPRLTDRRHALHINNNNVFQAAAFLNWKSLQRSPST